MKVSRSSGPWRATSAMPDRARRTPAEVGTGSWATSTTARSRTSWAHAPAVEGIFSTASIGRRPSWTSVGGLRHRPVRPGVGRQEVADRSQPARRHRAAPGGDGRGPGRRPHECQGPGYARDRHVVEYLDHGAVPVHARHVILAVRRPPPSSSPGSPRSCPKALGQMSYGAVRSGRGATKKTRRSHGTTSTRWRPPDRVSTCPDQPMGCASSGTRQPGTRCRSPPRSASMPSHDDRRRCIGPRRALPGAHRDEARVCVADGPRLRHARSVAAAGADRGARPRENIHLAGDYFAELGRSREALTAQRPIW